MRIVNNLRGAVIAFVLLPLLGVLIVTGALGLRELEQQMLQRMQEDIELVARAIRLPVAAAMVRTDIEAAQQALDSAFEIDQIFGAYVYNDAGERVASRGPRSPLLERRREARAVTAEGTQGSFDERRGRAVFSFFLPLFDPAGQVVGLLQVTRDVGGFRAYLAQLRWIGGIGIGALAAVFLIVVLVGHHRAVGRHVRALTAAMQPIGSGEPGLRVPTRGPRELAVLGVGINAMIARWEASEQRLQEQRLAQAALEQALLQSEKLAAVGRLAAGLAHELGTPLGSVAGRAQRAARRLPENAPARAELKTLMEELGRVERIVRQLLDFTRRNPAVRRWVDLPGLLTGLVERLRHADPDAARQLRIDCRVAPTAGPIIVPGDPLRLEQAIGNLLDNAVQAAHSEVRATCRSIGDQVELRICDDGPGVDPGIVDRLFEPFVTTKPVGQGTGLGLAVARAAILEHGGELILEGDRGPGGTAPPGPPAPGPAGHAGPVPWPAEPGQCARPSPAAEPGRQVGSRVGPGRANGACFLIRLPAADRVTHAGDPRDGR
ncbi:ATP-binding protein [Thiocapsa sp.]|uniref:sensor histidine kinase n=1 Tax=Thiocapsa sp. TaxID=2024551 RepID=UPI0025D42831|nr:ATP-binding protein [Thiocapsa sp.]